MKRLVSVFLVLCMMLSCVAFGETLDGAQGEIMNEVSDVASDEVQTPDEPTQAPVNEDDIVLPDMDDDISILPSDDVNGPDPYRELVLLQPTDLIGTTLSETSVRIGCRLCDAVRRVPQVRRRRNLHAARLRAEQSPVL